MVLPLLPEGFAVPPNMAIITAYLTSQITFLWYFLRNLPSFMYIRFIDPYIHFSFDMNKAESHGPLLSQQKYFVGLLFLIMTSLLCLITPAKFLMLFVPQRQSCLFLLSVPMSLVFCVHLLLPSAHSFIFCLTSYSTLALYIYSVILLHNEG